MKIAVFSNAFPARVSTFFSRDIRTLIDAGHEVDIYTLRPLEADLFRYVPDYLGPEVLRRDRIFHYSYLKAIFSFFRLNIFIMFRLLFEILYIIPHSLPYGPVATAKSIYSLLLGAVYANKNTNKYDMTISYWGNYSATSSIFFHKLMKSSSPFVMFLHAGTDLYRTPIIMEKKLLYADSIVTVCKYNKLYLSKKFPKVYDKIKHKIYLHILGIDIEDFSCYTGKRKEDLIVAVGGMDYNKGFNYLIEAIHILKQRGRYVNLELIGDGKEGKALRKLTADLGIQDRTTFYGWQPNDFVHATMKRATMLVHPSSMLGDSMPTVLKEAMSLGTPVAASVITCIPELLGNSKYGLLFPPRDADAIADRIEQVLDSPELRSRLSVLGRKRIEQLADSKVNGRRFASHINQLAKLHIKRFNQNRPRLFFIGNHLSHVPGYRQASEELMTHLGRHGYQVYHASTISNPYLRAYDMVYKLIRFKKDYDIAFIDVFSSKSFLWAAVTSMVLSFLNKPYIHVLHGGNLPALAKRRPKIVRYFLSLANTSVAPSNYLRQQLIQYRGDIITIPNALDVDMYEKITMKDNRKNIVYLRSIISLYNVKMAIRAIERVCMKYPDTMLHIIGPVKDPAYQKSLEREVQERKLDKNVEFLGGIPFKEVPAVLKKMDIFVNPTHIDNTPVSLLESMACNIPVVSTNVGGISYMVKHDHDCLLVNDNDDKQMAKYIIDLIEDDELYRKITRNGLDTVQKCDWSTVLTQWDEVICAVSYNMPEKLDIW